MFKLCILCHDVVYEMKKMSMQAGNYLSLCCDFTECHCLDVITFIAQIMERNIC